MKYTTQKLMQKRKPYIAAGPGYRVLQTASWWERARCLCTSPRTSPSAVGLSGLDLRPIGPRCTQSRPFM